MLTSKGIIKNVIFSVRRRYSIQHQKVIMGVASLKCGRRCGNTGQYLRLECWCGYTWLCTGWREKEPKCGNISSLSLIPSCKMMLAGNKRRYPKMSFRIFLFCLDFPDLGILLSKGISMYAKPD